MRLALTGIRKEDNFAEWWTPLILINLNLEQQHVTFAKNNEDSSWKKIAATTGAKEPPKNLLSTAFFRGGKEKKGNEALLRGQEKGERK